MQYESRSCAAAARLPAPRWVSNWVSITLDFRGLSRLSGRLRKPLELRIDQLRNDWGSRGREFESPQPDGKLQVRGQI